MIIGSDSRVSSRIWLCVAIAALGLIAVSNHFPLHVYAQTAQPQTARRLNHRRLNHRRLNHRRLNHRRLNHDMADRNSQRIRLPRWARLIRLPGSTLM